jgi:hypothetical protein
MSRLIAMLQRWFFALTASERPPDPLAQFSARDYADLPVSHPRCDAGC